MTACFLHMKKLFKHKKAFKLRIGKRNSSDDKTGIHVRYEEPYMRLTTNILAFNTGSSSIKFSLYAFGESERLVFNGSLSRIGAHVTDCLVLDDHGKSIVHERVVSQDHKAACEYVFSWILSMGEGFRPDAVGHRIVHGGPLFSTPQLVTSQIIASIETLSPYAPEHIPQAINVIRHTAKLFPGIPQVTSFDTSFHSTMPPVARLYALPESIRSEGVQRYGFHGLSYEYLLLELQRQKGREALQKRIILAHLGHGASMSAVKDGKSIETTMGFSPAGGMVMSTRTGDLDPGVILFLLQQDKMTPAAIKEMVNRQSGLLGVSGRTDDMLDLLNAEEVDAAARQAVELFCYQARKYIGSLAAVLGGLDTLVFTGGIGEHSPEIRSRICADLEFLSLLVDERKNSANSSVISQEDGQVEILIIKTNEELMIARHTMEVLEQSKT